jgi:hypothetical protein
LQAICRFWSHTIWRRAKNLWLTFKDVAVFWKKKKKVFASADVVRARMEACKSCEHFDSARQCEICGCFMDAKARFYAARCALVDEGKESKWPS